MNLKNFSKCGFDKNICLGNFQLKNYIKFYKHFSLVKEMKLNPEMNNEQLGIGISNEMLVKWIDTKMLF